MRNGLLLVLILVVGATVVKADEVPHRSPVDLALSPDGKWLVTANETSDSVSLVSTANGTVLDEVPCGKHPAAIQLAGDGQTVLVTSKYDGRLTLLRVAGGKLERLGDVDLGYEPCGITLHPDGKRAFVGLVASGQIAEVDLQRRAVTRRFDVGKWPRYLTLNPDGTRLAVGCGGESRIAVLDTKTGEELFSEPLANGINLGHMYPSADGQYAYFTWMVYRSNPITVQDIKRGWVLASRIARIRFDESTYREAISLDVPERAVADPLGIAITPDQQRLVASAGGTHELLVYRLPDLPLQGVGGPGDLIDRRLAADRSRFFRIELGGRPMGLEIARDTQRVYVANYFRDSVQVVDLESRKVVNEFELGRPERISLARRGMEIFYDGRRSLDQWYSCQTCHQEGGSNARAMDTFNDGTPRTPKTVLPLYNVTRTAPWTWHGWQRDFSDAMHKSMTVTMQGKQPSDRDVAALKAYLETLVSPPNPFRNPDGSLAAAAERGKRVFESSKAGCADCHSGPYFTDGKIHDVGLGSPKDKYDGYNTPSLNGVYRKVRLLHSGRAKTLERVVKDLHSPERVNGTGGLTDVEYADLIEYLKSL